MKSRKLPSADHPGRVAFNWSIFNAGDQMLLRYCERFQGHLVDLGCGRRTLEKFLLEHCASYTGVDWGNSLHGRSADLIADLNRPLPLTDEFADTVVSFSVMEHLSNPQQFLAEAARILKPGGSILLQVPFMWRVHEEPHDYFRFTRFGLEHMFRSAGFREVGVHAITGFWVMWVLKLNYQAARVTRGRTWFNRTCAAIFWPFFWIGQTAAVLLDRVWPNGEGETAGYFVVAIKPPA